MDRMISDTDLARLYLSLEGAQLVRDLLSEGDTTTDGFDLDLLASMLAECPPENAASWRLLQRLGFSPSGSTGARKGARLLIFEAPAVVE